VYNGFFIVCAALSAVSCLSAVLFCVICATCVLRLTVVSLPLGKKTFAVKIINNNINKNTNSPANDHSNAYS
jgi:hypothetical protein